MFNVLTVTREYGSGGSEIGRRVAKLLGWELLDRQLIERVAAMGKIDLTSAEQLDGKSGAWWEQLLSGFRHGGPELYVGDSPASEIDHDALQKLTARIIVEAGNTGNCVIVGRSSQCALRQFAQAFHVLVYAPVPERLERIRQRYPQEHSLIGLLHQVDQERIRYAHTYFGCDSTNRQLYHLCLNSTIGLDACAELIVSAMHSARREAPVKCPTAPAEIR
ncbi:MAG TPA: cytidylate kinase-like family protein [Candidatus Saccharimonadales bacterium]|nr:cytidylate kinase-like family protein [Candidatus Saccharimonadales bacterium]